MERNIGRGKCTILKCTHSSDIQNDILPHYEMNNIIASNSVMVLSERGWKRYKDSSIFTSNKLVSKYIGCDHISYDSVEYGSSVKTKKRRSISNGKGIRR